MLLSYSFIKIIGQVSHSSWEFSAKSEDLGLELLANSTKRLETYVRRKPGVLRFQRCTAEPPDRSGSTRNSAGFARTFDSVYSCFVIVFARLGLSALSVARPRDPGINQRSVMWQQLKRRT